MGIERILKWGNKKLDLSTPAVMGILNLTPDSFYDGGRFDVPERAVEQAVKMVDQGAAIVDIGAVSSRPFAEEVSEAVEWSRLEKVLPELVSTLPGTIISVDTYRADIAVKAAKAGAGMINDISGGQMDERMFGVIAGLEVAYVLMHIKGTPQNMQQNPQYDDVVEEVNGFFEQNLQRIRNWGVKTPVILDPGFGFGKSLEHNYHLLKALPDFKTLGCPILAGVSRKSMINKVLKTKPENACNGTTVVNTISLLQGADILRVHDVKEAVEAVKLVKAYQEINSAGHA
jgi:dihydropteroate synthase